MLPNLGSYLIDLSANSQLIGILHKAMVIPFRQERDDSFSIQIRTPPKKRDSCLRATHSRVSEKENLQDELPGAVPRREKPSALATALHIARSHCLWVAVRTCALPASNDFQSPQRDRISMIVIARDLFGFKKRRQFFI
jgi:hypothetical protein